MNQSRGRHSDSLPAAHRIGDSYATIYVLKEFTDALQYTKSSYGDFVHYL